MDNQAGAMQRYTKLRKERDEFRKKHAEIFDTFESFYSKLDRATDDLVEEAIQRKQDIKGDYAEVIYTAPTGNTPAKARVRPLNPSN